MSIYTVVACERHFHNIYNRYSSVNKAVGYLLNQMIYFSHEHKFDGFKFYEPMATANKSYDQWVGERLEDCIMDENERECNFWEGDIVDHPLVSVDIEYSFLTMHL